MEEKIKFEDKKIIVLKFFEENNDKGFSQGELVRLLETKLKYKDQLTARVSIIRILKQLEEDKKIYFQVDNTKRGYIPAKIWYKK